MDSRVLLELGVIFFSAKLFGVAAERLRIPQVIGEIVAGLLIGPSVLGIVQGSEVLNTLAEIGVVMLMYFAGLETDLPTLLKSGAKAFVIACMGVAVPLICGFVLYGLYYGFAPAGDEEFFSALFMGVILTATSVSITVAALTEMGQLRTETGAIIMSAAIIDDVIGMLVLTFAVGLHTPGTSVGRVLLSTAAFFALAAVTGLGVHRLFAFLERHFPHTRRLPIFGLALCFLTAYAADRFFGIADITGAYVAGVMLCSNKEHSYLSRRVDIASYMVFSPIFFASIGIKTQITGMTPSLWGFSLVYVAVALGAKILGCGGAAHLLGCSPAQSLKIGVGMMTRGEVALIIAQKALSLGVLDAEYFTAVILLIIVSSAVTPLLLKQCYLKVPEVTAAQGTE